MPEDTSAPRDMAPLVPDTYRGVFQGRVCEGQSSDYPIAPYQATLMLADITFNDYTFDRFPIGVPTAIQTFQDECQAYYTTDLDTPDNADTLDDLLNQMAQDFFLGRQFSIDYVYQGINQVQPNALIDTIEFSYDLDEPARDDDTIDALVQRLRPQCTTRVQSEPWTGYPERFQHWDHGGFDNSCEMALDRSPGFLILRPAAPGTTKFTSAVLTLEDGRLQAVYEGSVSPPCSCSVCLPLCVSATRCGNTTPQPGFTVTASYRSVTSITVTNAGHGYTTPPAVTFSTFSGTGATATAVLSGNTVGSVSVITGGIYISAPNVVFSGGGGTAAAATAVMGSPITVGSCVTDGTILSITKTNSGSGYTSAPTLMITGDGVGATAIANMVATVNSFMVTNPGSGYTSAPTMSVVPTGATGRVLLTATTIDHINVVTAGTYFTSSGIPTVSFVNVAGYSGSGATAVAAMTMTSAGVGATGTGYTIGDLITVTGGTSTTVGVVTVTNVDGGGGIATVAIHDAGRYTAYPATASPVTGGTGTGATLSIVWKIADITVTSGGTGYNNAPTVNFSGVGGGTAQAFLTATTIASVTRTASGSGYLVPPICTLSGGAGSGAVITAILDPFTVGSFTVVTGGNGYTTAALTLSGGGGSGGAGTPVIIARCCIDDLTTPGTYILSSPDPSCVTNGNATWTCNSGGSGTLRRTINASIPFTYCGGNTNFASVPNTPVVITGPGNFTLSTSIGFGANAISLCVGLDGTYQAHINTSCFVDPSSVMNSGIAIASSPCTQTTSSIALIAKTYTAIIRVRACQITVPAPVLQGATVTVTGGGYSQTATTDPSGFATLSNLPAVCVYTITISKSRFATLVLSTTGPCQDSTTTSLWLDVSSMSPAAGYMCCSPFIEPIPLVLFADDANGTTTLNVDPTVAGRRNGCYTYHDSNLACFSAGPSSACDGQVFGPPAHVLTPGSGTVSVGFIFDCSGSILSPPALTALNPICPAPGFTPDKYVTAGWCAGDFYRASQGIGCGVPPSGTQADFGTPGFIVLNTPTTLIAGSLTIPVNLTYSVPAGPNRPGGTINVHE